MNTCANDDYQANAKPDCVLGKWQALESVMTVIAMCQNVSSNMYLQKCFQMREKHLLDPDRWGWILLPTGFFVLLKQALDNFVDKVCLLGRIWILGGN